LEARSRVGGVWSTGYVGQGAQSPSWFYEFSEFPVGDRYPLFMKKEDLCSYIDDYVSHFKLGSHIRCNVLVKDLENLDGKAWRVTTEDGHQRVFDKVVICTGLFRKKHIPDFSGMDRTKVEVLHSSDCSDRSAFTGKDVVFVGYGKSTLDLMNELKDEVKSSTGFEAAMEILPSECKEKLICDKGEGPWLYRHIVHPDFMHLAFVGWASTNISISSLARRPLERQDLCNCIG
ncbi:monooxygenase, partial [Perkinsus olseni]